MITLRDLKDNNIKVKDLEDNPYDEKEIAIAVGSKIEYSQKFTNLCSEFDWNKVPYSLLDKRLLEIYSEASNLYIVVDYNREDD